MKKVSIALILCMLFTMISVGVSAEGSNAVLPRLVDNADILTDAEESTLLQKLDSISEEGQYDMVIVTTDDLEGKTAQDYADNFYDYNGYGYGNGYDGILLLISTEGRGEICVSTHGRIYECLSNSDIDSILDYSFEYFINNDNYRTCTAFADRTQQLIEMNQSDKEVPQYLRNAIIAFIVGLIIALIAVSVMKSQLKSVKFQTSASNYVRKESLNITDSSDIYLYNTVTKVPIPRDNTSSGGSSHHGGGGSHVSSSGRTHGGGGRSR